MEGAAGSPSRWLPRNGAKAAVPEEVDGKSNINVVVFGNAQCGKSTLVGNMLKACGMLRKDHQDRLVKSLECFGHPSDKKMPNPPETSLKLALDTSKEEMARGMSMRSSFAELDTAGRHFTLIDTPGYDAFVISRVRGAAQADAALLVVSGELRAYSPAKENQERFRQQLLFETTRPEFLVRYETDEEKKAFYKMYHQTLLWDLYNEKGEARTKAARLLLRDRVEIPGLTFFPNFLPEHLDFHTQTGKWHVCIAKAEWDRRGKAMGERPDLDKAFPPKHKAKRQELLNLFGERLQQEVKQFEGSLKDDFKAYHGGELGSMFQQVRLLRAAGVERIAVAVTKMDRSHEEGFKDIAESVRYLFTLSVRYLFTLAGYSEEFASNIPIVPVISFGACNAKAESDDTFPWFKGQTVNVGGGPEGETREVSVRSLYDVFDKCFSPPMRTIGGPLRMPVERAYFKSGVVVGVVEQGEVAVGDEVVFLPQHSDAKPCKGVVEEVQRCREKVDCARAGDWVGVKLKGFDRKQRVKSGSVMVLAKDAPPAAAEVDASIVVYQTDTRKTKIKVGSNLLGIVGQAVLNFQVAKLTGLDGEELDCLYENQQGSAVLQPIRPIFLDACGSTPVFRTILFVDPQRHRVVMTATIETVRAATTIKKKTQRQLKKQAREGGQAEEGKDKDDKDDDKEKDEGKDDD